MKERKTSYTATLAITFAVLFCLSLSVNAVQSADNRILRNQLSMERQRDVTDVADAMADIEINLQKLLIASGARQSASLLSKTALLAQHVETGLSRLPMSQEASADAMKFAGQMGDYAMTLAAQVSGGGMLTTGDEAQIEGMLAACQGLNAHLQDMGARIYEEPVQENGMYADAGDGLAESAISGKNGVDYPSLIYDGPFSDGRAEHAPRGLEGERVTREQAREAAARFAGTTPDRVRDAEDSGGRLEAFGFTADADGESLSVQITGQGGRLLWMMPENAQYETRLSREACLKAAGRWLLDSGFGDMERCFVQEYDGMVVANFAAVQDGVLLYPDQVKVQVSMETGRVVGAECSQYLMNHSPRETLSPGLSREEALMTLSSRLDVYDARLCMIPSGAGERLCWEFRGMFAGEMYYAYVDAESGEAVEILRIARTQEGETAI